MLPNFLTYFAEQRRAQVEGAYGAPPVSFFFFWGGRGAKEIADTNKNISDTDPT